MSERSQATGDDGFEASSVSSSAQPSGFSPGAATSWFVSDAGKTQGPLGAQRITQLIRWGKISERAYVCDERLSCWVSIHCTAFAALAASHRVLAPLEVEVIHPLGLLRGGPWQFSTRAAQRLSGLLTALSVFAGALEFASGIAMSRRSGVAPDSVRSAPAAER